MMMFHKLVTTVLGIGYLQKGAGTVAALVCCILWYYIPAASFNGLRQVFFTLLLTILGVWSGNHVEKCWGKDSNRVVIDEWVGMMITLLWIPVGLATLVAGLLLFRFFDIAKPLFIRRLEALPGGYGVMADDVLAGIYAHIVLWAIVQFNLLPV